MTTKPGNPYSCPQDRRPGSCPDVPGYRGRYHSRQASTSQRETAESQGAVEPVGGPESLYEERVGVTGRPT